MWCKILHSISGVNFNYAKGNVMWCDLSINMAAAVAVGDFRVLLWCKLDLCCSWDITQHRLIANY